MEQLYQRFGIAPKSIANVVAFAIGKPVDTNVSEFTVRLHRSALVSEQINTRKA